jgi:hypothetical protein
MSAVAASADRPLTSKLQTPPPNLGRKGVALLITTTTGATRGETSRLPGLGGI